jgi:uridine phosphorylase
VNPKDAIVNPKKGNKSPELGDVAVMAGSEADLQTLCSLMRFREDQKTRLFMSRLYVGNDRPERISLAGPFIGAPYASMLMETLITWGACKIIFLGWCGAVSPTIKIGDIILPTSAIIDEGTSKHYHPDESGRARPSVYITEKIKMILKARELAFSEGLVWCTDAIYRETRAKVAYYQNKRVLAVEMETSALFTVGKFRDVDVGSILVVSDELSTFKWRPGFRAERFEKARRSVCEVIHNLCRII